MLSYQRTVLREAYLPELEEKVKRTPYEGSLCALLGARLAEAHEQGRSSEMLRRAIGSGENNAYLWQTLAASIAAQGDIPRAMADLRLGARMVPAARTLRDAQQRITALGSDPSPFAAAQAICPEGPGPLTSLYARGSILNGVFVWWAARHPEGSGFATREQWAAQKPNDAETQRLWGLALLKNRRLPEAGTVLNHAALLAPNSPKIHLAVAQALEAAGRDSSAGLEYIKALKLQRDWLPALLGLGKNAERSGLTFARRAYLRATLLFPDSADAWIGLGRSSVENSATWDEALKDFQRAERLSPQRTDFYIEYADALKKNRRIPEAESILRRRLQEASDDALCRTRLGELLMAGQKFPASDREAEEQFRTAIRLAPRALPAKQQLGLLLLRQKRIPEAITVLESARQDNPYEVTVLNTLAKAYSLNRQPESASAVFAKARRIFTQQQQILVLEIGKQKDFGNEHIHRQLAALYKNVDDIDKSEQEMQMAALLHRDPEGTMQSIHRFRNQASAVLPD